VADPDLISKASRCIFGSKFTDTQDKPGPSNFFLKPTPKLVGKPTESASKVGEMNATAENLLSIDANEEVNQPASEYKLPRVLIQALDNISPVSVENEVQKPAPESTIPHFCPPTSDNTYTSPSGFKFDSAWAPVSSNSAPAPASSPDIIWVETAASSKEFPIWVPVPASSKGLYLRWKTTPPTPTTSRLLFASPQSVSSTLANSKVSTSAFNSILEPEVNPKSLTPAFNPISPNFLSNPMFPSPTNELPDLGQQVEAFFSQLNTEKESTSRISHFRRISFHHRTESGKDLCSIVKNTPDFVELEPASNVQKYHKVVDELNAKVTDVSVEEDVEGKYLEGSLKLRTLVI
jgi:hypothetical protein